MEQLDCRADRLVRYRAQVVHAVALVDSGPVLAGFQMDERHRASHGGGHCGELPARAGPLRTTTSLSVPWRP